MAARDPEVDAIVDAHPDGRGVLLAKLRDIIHEADPDVTEAAKWMMPCSPLGAAVFEHDGIVCILIPLKGRVRLSFVAGSRLPDPKKLFNSSLDGNVRRAIDVAEGEQLDEAAFQELVRAAVALNSDAARKKPRAA